MSIQTQNPAGLGGASQNLSRFAANDTCQIAEIVEPGKVAAIEIRLNDTRPALAGSGNLAVTYRLHSGHAVRRDIPASMLETWLFWLTSNGAAAIQNRVIGGAL